MKKEEKKDLIAFDSSDIETMRGILDRIKVQGIQQAQYVIMLAGMLGNGVKINENFQKETEKGGK